MAKVQILTLVAVQIVYDSRFVNSQLKFPSANSSHIHCYIPRNLCYNTRYWYYCTPFVLLHEDNACYTILIWHKTRCDSVTWLISPNFARDIMMCILHLSFITCGLSYADWCWNDVTARENRNRRWLACCRRAANIIKNIHFSYRCFVITKNTNQSLANNITIRIKMCISWLYTSYYIVHDI